MTRSLRIQRAATVAIAIAFTGCAPQTYWVHPGIAPEMQRHQFAIDSTECMARAQRLIPDPERAPRPQPQSGTVTLYTPNGPVYGEYNDTQPTALGADTAPTSVLDGWQRTERDANRRNYGAACMAQRGWQQHAAGQ